LLADFSHPADSRQADVLTADEARRGRDSALRQPLKSFETTD
jgi:hypothetical protein